MTFILKMKKPDNPKKSQSIEDFLHFLFNDTHTKKLNTDIIRKIISEQKFKI